MCAHAWTDSEVTRCAGASPRVGATRIPFTILTNVSCRLCVYCMSLRSLGMNEKILNVSPGNFPFIDGERKLARL